LPGELVLGDPGARDTTVHAVQACIPHATILPIGVERLTIDPMPASEKRFVEAHETGREGAVLVYDVLVRDSAGAVRERWQDLRLRIMGDAARPASWPAALLAPYVERRVAELVAGSAPAVALLEMNGEDRHARSDAAIRAALGRRANVLRRADGKPEVEGSQVSAAHSGSFTLAIAGDSTLGCDLEAVVERGEDDWRGLLGAERWSLAARLAREAGEDIHTAATRVWSAAESARKAGLIDVPLTLRSASAGGWTLLDAGALAVATLATTVRGAATPMVVAVLTSPGTTRIPSPTAGH
jgi:enediyne polyketide synthase